MMDDPSPGAVFACAIRTFIDRLPRPIWYASDALSRDIQQIVAPSAGLFVFASGGSEQDALASVEQAASRTRTDGIALGRRASNPHSLRFDLVLRRKGRSETFTDYAFTEAVGGGLFAPVKSGRLVRLGAGGLTPGDEVYFRMENSRLASIDRAASGITTRYFENI